MFKAINAKALNGDLLTLNEFIEALTTQGKVT
jgi:hypothetical protein